MKFFFLFLPFISFQAFACPQLAGVYKVCRSSTDQNKTAEVIVEQKIVNKYCQYTITTRDSETENARVEKYTADGKMKIVSDTDSDTGITIRTETLATHQNDILTIKMNATLDSEAFADVTIKASKVGSQFTQIFSGISMGEPVSDTIICQ
jgi:hypothetical protein